MQETGGSAHRNDSRAMKPLSSNLINKLSPFDPKAAMAFGENRPADVCRYRLGYRCGGRGSRPVFPRSGGAGGAAGNVLEGVCRTCRPRSPHGPQRRWLVTLAGKAASSPPLLGFKELHTHGGGVGPKWCGQNAFATFRLPSAGVFSFNLPRPRRPLRVGRRTLDTSGSGPTGISVQG